MTENKTIASESGHWYQPDGTPCYEIENKSNPGTMRGTTLRDAKKLGLYPSVTVVLSVIPKPALITWMKKQVLMSALTLTRLSDETDEAFINRIMLDADEQAKKAREKGTWIHGQIERHLLETSIELDALQYVDSTMDALRDLLGLHWKKKCLPEKSFASELGYGGKVDLHSRELNFVLDFKTKEFDETADKLAWDEQVIQLEAYRRGLNMPDARMINVFISTNHPGLVRVVEHENGNDWHWNVFKDALQFWKTWKKV